MFSGIGALVEVNGVDAAMVYAFFYFTSFGRGAFYVFCGSLNIRASGFSLFSAILTFMVGFGYLILALSCSDNRGIVNPLRGNDETAPSKSDNDVQVGDNTELEVQSRM